MHKFELGKLKYSYVVGPYTVGIIPQSRRKHIVAIKDIKIANGVPQHIAITDGHVSPEEVANYIIFNKIV